jgi:hypothetical protein
MIAPDGLGRPFMYVKGFSKLMRCLQLPRFNKLEWLQLSISKQAKVERMGFHEDLIAQLKKGRTPDMYLSSMIEAMFYLCETINKQYVCPW